MKKYLKITLAFLFFFLSSYSFSQVEFESKHLKLLQVIALNTNYENIHQAMESLKLKTLTIKNRKDSTELITFKHIENDVKLWILYSKDKKLIYIRFEGDVIMGANNQIDLENHGFKIVGESVGSDFIKENYPYSFSLQTINYTISVIYLFNYTFGKLDQYIDYGEYSYK